MSCRDTHGNAGITALAAAATGSRVDDVAKRFHALRNEGRGLDSPDPSQVQEYLAKAAFRARNDPALPRARADRILAHLDAAGDGPLPDGATFYAWQHLQADLDAQRVVHADSGSSMPEAVSARGRTDAATPAQINAMFTDGLPASRISSDPDDLTDPARRQEAKRQVSERLAERMADLTDSELIGPGKAALLADPAVTAWAPTREGGWEPDPGGIPGKEGRLAPDDPALREGLRREAVSNLVARWAVTSNGSDPEALAIQQIAAREFGLAGSAGWDASPELAAAVDTATRQRGRVYTSFLRASYAETQDELARRGITSVKVYRGFSWDADADAGGVRRPPPAWADQEDGDRPVPLRPMSSCSTSRSVAAGFAAGKLGGNGRHRTLIETTVPASRILSTPRTGAGCLPEREIVVLSGPGTWSVSTAHAGEWGAGMDPPEDDEAFFGDDPDGPDGPGW